MHQDASGAVADIPYTAGFYNEMAPSHLAFATIAAGRAPGAAAQPRRVLELGVGRGFGLALLAAASPDIIFEGHDVDANNIAHAKRLVELAQLENATLTLAGFEDAVAQTGKADADIITMHGVLSWVSGAAREAAIGIVGKRLRPDGLFYVSYNCMPGWAPMEPIRRFALAVKQRVAATPLEQLNTALGMLSSLRAGKAVYFAASASAGRHFDGMVGMDLRYLVHEYFAEHWEPLNFADVAAQMAAAGLSFAASATLTENLDQCAVPKDVQPLVKQTADPVLREMLRDFAGNKQFRRDIYARNAAPSTAEETLRAWSRIRFVLVIPRARVTFTFLGPLRELHGNPLLYEPIVDRLAQSAASFEELAIASGLGSKLELLTECLTLLVHSGQVLPVMSSSQADAAPAKRFNRVVIEEAREGRVFGSLAAPVIRTGIPVPDFALLALSALLDGSGHMPHAAAQHGLKILKALGRRPMKDLQPIENDNDAIDFLVEHMQPILEEAVPVWRRLGII